MMNDKTPHHKKSGPDARNTHSLSKICTYLMSACLSVGVYNYDHLKGNAAHRPPVIDLTNALYGPNAIINCAAGDNSYGT